MIVSEREQTTCHCGQQIVREPGGWQWFHPDRREFGSALCWSWIPQVYASPVGDEQARKELMT